MNFNEDSQIIEAEVIEKEPRDLPVSFGLTEKELTVQPTLLNTGDSLTVKALLTGDGNFVITGRIVGIKQIKKRPYIDPDVTDARNIITIGVIGLIVLAATTAILRFFGATLPSILNLGINILVGVAISLILIFFFLGIFQYLTTGQSKVSDSNDK